MITWKGNTTMSNEISSSPDTSKLSFFNFFFPGMLIGFTAFPPKPGL